MCKIPSRLGTAAGLALFSMAAVLLIGASDLSPKRVSVASDTTGARLFLERQGDILSVQGAYVNADAPSGRLAYELDVRRVGEAGTSQSTQSGRFETAPGQTDTLSTVQINVQSGDQFTLHLTIRRGERLVDETRRQHSF